MSLVLLVQVLWVLLCAFGGITYGRRSDAVGGPFGAGLGTLLAMVFGCMLISILLGPFAGAGGYRPL